MKTDSSKVTGSTAKAGETWNTEDGRTMVAIETAQGLMPMEMIHEIPTGDVRPHPANRDEFDEQKTSDMEDSLRANGQLTPALLRPLSEGKYQLIAGSAGGVDVWRWVSRR